MKKGLLTFFLPLFIVKIVSAQFYSGYGWSFSITGLLDSIGPENITFMTLFIIFFAVIFYSLSNVFKDPYGQPNKPIAGVLAFAISALISYGIYQSGFDLTGFFYGLGIDEGLLYPIVSVVFFVMVALIIKYLGIGGFLILFGLSLFLIAVFTDIVYERTFLGIIGGILFIVGFFIWRRNAAKKLGEYALQRAKSKPKWVIVGIGVILAIIGFILEQEIIIIIGIVLALMGFFFKKSRRSGEIPPYTRSGGRSGFSYEQGIRRGGLKPTRGRFVSRRATERYARRFGRAAAERRFG